MPKTRETRKSALISLVCVLASIRSATNASASGVRQAPWRSFFVETTCFAHSLALQNLRNKTKMWSKTRTSNGYFEWSIKKRKVTNFYIIYCKIFLCSTHIIPYKHNYLAQLLLQDMKIIPKIQKRVCWDGWPAAQKSNFYYNMHRFYKNNLAFTQYICIEVYVRSIIR